MSDERTIVLIEDVGSALEIAKQHRTALEACSKEILERDRDYGVIPGTGNKPTLLKPGAEKLCSFFRLTPRFVLIDKELDWERGVFYFQYQCELYTRDGVLIATGNGSCNSHESKYRWRKAERKCPTCGAEAIIKGKAEYGGGWLCWAKKGGCGAKFGDNAPEIVNQEVGRVPNPDPADQVNTIDKMAQKRALIAAVLIGLGASEFYTQDIEDMTIDGDFEQVPPITRSPHARVIKPHEQTEPVHRQQHWIDNQDIYTRFWALADTLGLNEDDVYEALGNVSAVDEFKGTMTEAKTALENYATAKKKGSGNSPLTVIMDGEWDEVLAILDQDQDFKANCAFLGWSPSDAIRSALDEGRVILDDEAQESAENISVYVGWIARQEADAEAKESEG